MTKQDIDNALTKWKDGLLKISRTYREGGDYKNLAHNFIKNMYAYNNSEVLFKPTLASKQMFRGDLDGAISYFVAGNDKYPEDNGFAIGPWAELEFENTGYIVEDNIGIVMGNKHLTQTDGTKVIANYTMGFKLNAKGEMQIVLHHSSLPYSPV
ncbi:phosphoribosyl-AMP cyclohydrolase [Francisella noatunensis]|uniref:Phosphoribosyl-AMP cyclohydrolase n=1 Tax=Francisella noatunensis TaxID=657445 RepID=A0A9Q2KWY1_9GAMM|nr:phosphoribosyl-AMP cyclohydrolase [Francisella noatunensis]MBK2028600.1 phosphoribosyl-AMP cyclohydrolase [Francisella noatunensis]MBK2034365.1 phosphoribosyl-AMP cyclohydrolase [Francisella noatunensis]MBK2048528.1 phosphoribosyl-AMP cyclohydrolase [Francisella noatunensis]MBK2050267.1 phosphoribosyl-AMP cyclohydrolase [Francisella noatunensis]MBK2051100.1 phosphoribosyl-AMP cyclohydrolase [Francisella noatunensis]